MLCPPYIVPPIYCAQDIEIAVLPCETYEPTPIATGSSGKPFPPKSTEQERRVAAKKKGSTKDNAPMALGACRLPRVGGVASEANQGLAQEIDTALKRKCLEAAALAAEDREAALAGLLAEDREAALAGLSAEDGAAAMQFPPEDAEDGNGKTFKEKLLDFQSERDQASLIAMARASSSLDHSKSFLRC